MISAETIAALEERGLLYILGVRERTDKLVRHVVLNDAAPFVPLAINKRGKQTVLPDAKSSICATWSTRLSLFHDNARGAELFDGRYRHFPIRVRPGEELQFYPKREA